MAENYNTDKARKETQTPKLPEWPVNINKNSGSKNAGGEDFQAKSLPQANFGGK